MYLTSACKQFDRALDISKEDIMWPSFINYNKSRTLYFLNLLSGSHDSWLDVMNETINSRSRLNRLVDEILSVSKSSDAEVIDTHLRTFFLYQEELARLVKLNLMISEKNNQPNISSIIYRGLEISNISKDDLEKTFVDIEEFPTIKLYQDDIIKKTYMKCDSI